MVDDTIAAIATPLGEGGIGIVRISGPEAINIGKTVFKAKYNHNWFDGPGFRMVYGHIINPKTNETVDEVILSLMRKPKSFTGEDVVEINCHGGILPLRKILEVVLNCGARLAEPGEFSKRAFLNGRLDLAQAESIIDIIRAKTDTGLKISVNHLQGQLSSIVNNIQHDILGILAQIEANIDFPEDEVDEVSYNNILKQTKNIKDQVEKLIASADTGRIYRDGVQTIIIGRPNVGKSSLLNALLKENRAIVTDIPGTTRDIIEEIINIGGIPLKIIDTAGLRETDDIVEKIGVEKSKELIKKADLILFIIDAADGFKPEDQEILKMICQNKVILIINKIDLHYDHDIQDEIAKNFPEIPQIEVSALYGTGIELLEQKISEMVLQGQVSVDDQVLVTKLRHKQALQKALRHLEDVILGIEANIPLDLISIDLKAAWEAIGEITGTTVSEDLIDRIFNDFCIGK